MARQPRKSTRSSKRSSPATPKARTTERAIEESGSLTEAMKAIATGYSRTKPAKPSVKVDTSLTEAMQDVASRPPRKTASTRAGRKGIVIYVDQDVAAG